MSARHSPEATCIQCGATLGWDRCKNVCARCGYFESCSDGGDTTAEPLPPPPSAAPDEPRRPGRRPT